MQMSPMSIADRLVVGTWSNPFPYLFHNWKVVDERGRYQASFVDRRSAWAYIVVREEEERGEF